MLVDFWPIATDKDHLRQVFDGVDGRAIVDEDTLLHPPEELKPASIPAPDSSSIDPALQEKREVVQRLASGNSTASTKHALHLLHAEHWDVGSATTWTL